MTIKTRACPACPDGNFWTAEGPTAQPCPLCLGFGELNMDGSPLAEAIESARKRKPFNPGYTLIGEDDE